MARRRLARLKPRSIQSADIQPANTRRGGIMSANTTQKLFENTRKVLQELLWFQVSSLWPMIQEGKRSAFDVLNMLQLVKDKPKEWELHVSVLRGTHHIVPVEVVFIVDTSNASMPQAWKDTGWWEVKEHKGLGVVEVCFADGEMYVNSRKVGEYLSEKQKVRRVSGYELRTELADKPTLPDAILDLLIREQANPAVNLFLQKYKFNVCRGKYPFFWSTIYRRADGGLYVRFLNGDGERFVGGDYLLSDDRDAGDPTLILEEEEQKAV